MIARMKSSGGAGSSTTVGLSRVSSLLIAPLLLEPTLGGAAPPGAPYVGYFLSYVDRVFGQLVGQAPELKSDNPPDSSQDRKRQNDDKNN